MYVFCYELEPENLSYKPEILIFKNVSLFCWTHKTVVFHITLLFKVTIYVHIEHIIGHR